MAASTTEISIALRTDRPALTTVFTPEPTCLSSRTTGYWFSKASNKKEFVSSIDNCSVSYSRYIYSPGIYCPPGWTAGYKDAVTDYGGPGIAETTLTCAPSGFTCTLRSCTSVANTQMVVTVHEELFDVSTASGPVKRYSTTYISTMRPPITVTSTAIALLYRATDVSEGFEAVEGARWAKEVSFISPGLSDAVIEPKSMAPNVVMSSSGRFPPPLIGVSIILGYTLLLLAGVFLFRWHHRRGLRKKKLLGRRRNVGSCLHLGVIPAIPALLSVPVGTFALLFGYMRNWQEYMIILWDSKDAVLRFMQVLGFVERMCASTMSWSIARDCGWLILAAGMPTASFIEVWDMSATGGTYVSLFNLFRTGLKPKNFRAFRWLLFIVLLLLVTSADLTGNAIIASTGIANSSGYTPQEVQNLPFTSIVRLNIPSGNGGPESGQSVLFSGAAYPHILQDRESDTYAFLPVQVGAEAPSYYSGVAYFGKMATHCQLIPISGVLEGNDWLGVWTVSLNITSMDLSSWNFKEKPETAQVYINSGPVGLETRSSKLVLGNLTSVITIPWRKPSSEVYEANYNAEWEDPRQAVHLFGAFRVHPNLKLLPAFIESTFTLMKPDNISHGSGNFSGLDESLIDGRHGTFNWEFQLCRVEVPYQVGTIQTVDINRETSPILNCDPRKTRFCPDDFRSRKARFSSVTWNDNVANRNLNASIVDKNTAWTAIQPFVQNKKPSAGIAVNYCHTCTSGRLASKYFSQLVAESSTQDFAEAFSGSFLHAIAATYRAQLPFFEGVGYAKWAVPREVSLVVRIQWLWTGVLYTWFVTALAISLRIKVLRTLGAERDGSALATAAMVEDPNNPLKPLLAMGDMHRKNDFDDDMEALPDIKNQMIKIGVLPNGRYGIGRADDVGRLNNRDRMLAKVPESEGVLLRQLDGADWAAKSGSDVSEAAVQEGWR